MSKSTAAAAAASSSTPAGERLSLGNASSPVGIDRPSYALPSLSSSSSSASNPDTSGSSSAALVTPAVLQLATPMPKFVDGHALHVMATEMVYSLIQSARYVSRKQALAREELLQAGISIPTHPQSSQTSSSSAAAAAATSTQNTSAGASNTTGVASSELDAAVSARLEAIGFHVGSHLVESLSRDRARFTETLDVLKFVCKELWTTVWGKQVDNLRTNHRGVYVLQDNHFRPLAHVSTARGSQETARESKLFLAYPVGIVRGALHQLEVPSVVVAETNQAPQCTFHVKTQRTSTAAP
ncbi:hypothetical protein BCV70DRAFT_202769, partial [Testicularia cyperi]